MAIEFDQVASLRVAAVVLVEEMPRMAALITRLVTSFDVMREAKYVGGRNRAQMD